MVCIRRAVQLLGLILATGATAFAQRPGPAESSTDASRHGLLIELQGLESKMIALAGAVPEDKLDWRPAPGVRSIGEVYFHVAQSNYTELARFGIPAPANLPPKLEASRPSRAEIVSQLRQSFQHMKRGVASMSTASLARSAEWPQPGYTVEGAVASMIRHLGEHLGQSIAYARMNGVVPPWSGSAR
jgi:hypothetical protein